MLVEDSSKNIESFIDENNKMILVVKESAHECKMSLEQIFNQIGKISVMSSEISAANSEQNHGIKEVNKAVQIITDSALQNTVQTQEVLGGMEQLYSEAVKLDGVVTEIRKIIRINEKIKDAA